MLSEEEEALLCLTEESAELIQSITKIFRFGIYTRHKDLPSNAEAFENELSDVLACVMIIKKLRIVDSAMLHDKISNKLIRLSKYSNNQFFIKTCTEVFEEHQKNHGK